MEERPVLTSILQPKQAVLSWSAIDLKDGKYLIYRSNDNVNFEKIGEKMSFAM